MGVTPGFTDGQTLTADGIVAPPTPGLNQAFADAFSLSQLTTQNVAGPVTHAGTQTFNGRVAFSGEIDDKVTVVVSGATYTVLSTDAVIFVNKTVGSATGIVLPAAPNLGRRIIVKDAKGDAATNNITITASQTIDGTAGATGRVINTNFGRMLLIYNGSSWSIMGT